MTVQLLANSTTQASACSNPAPVCVCLPLRYWSSCQKAPRWSKWGRQCKTSPACRSRTGLPSTCCSTAAWGRTQAPATTSRCGHTKPGAASPPSQDPAPCTHTASPCCTSAPQQHPKHCQGTSVCLPHHNNTLATATTRCPAPRPICCLARHPPPAARYPTRCHSPQPAGHLAPAAWPYLDALSLCWPGAPSVPRAG
jgi:hypothetical protein